MTNERAIQILENLIGIDGDIIIGSEDREALEMAVRSLQQEQPNRPDFEDVDPKHLVHSHYTKVRETKTGRVFWAEYSSEAAEWYEAGTGKAYSISDVEIVKEQPEVDLEKVVMIDNVIMNMTAEGYNNGYKTRPFYEEVLRRFNARKE